jgi:hypothetical protein
VNDSGAHTVGIIDLSSVWTPGGALKISELFPRATPSVPEWIELVNVSGMPVNLKGWRFGPPGSTDTVTAADFMLQPQDYCVLVKDRRLFLETYGTLLRVCEPPHWQALSNYGDTIVLYSPHSSAASEKVFYASAWFDDWTSGSLERVGLDGDGMTRSQWARAATPSPGQPNRSTLWRAVQSASMDIGPVPFSPNGDGADERLGIRFTLPAGAAVSVSIYGFDGTCIFEFSGVFQEVLYWDGRTRRGADAPVGPFFVIAEIDENGKTSRIRKKGILWR